MCGLVGEPGGHTQEQFHYERITVCADPANDYNVALAWVSFSQLMEQPLTWRV